MQCRDTVLTVLRLIFEQSSYRRYKDDYYARTTNQR